MTIRLLTNKFGQFPALSVLHKNESHFYREARIKSIIRFFSARKLGYLIH